MLNRAQAKPKWRHVSPPDMVSRRSSGVTLIEVMIAILILSFALLGIAGLQITAAKYKIDTWARAAASSLISDLSERVRINTDAAGTSFFTAVPTTSAYAITDSWATQQSASFTVSTNCETTSCNSADRATYDLLVWRQRVRDAMPQGAALISGTRRDGLDVTLMWMDKDMINPTDKTLAAATTCTGSESGMAQQTCCPSAAAVPSGVRCARFTFVP